MNAFKKLLGGGSKTPPDPGKQSAAYERFMKEDFGLTRVAGGWSYTGPLIDDMASQWVDPSICLDALKEIKKKKPFSNVCVLVSSQKSILVCNTKPKPMGILTSLNAKGVADLISIVIKEKGQAVEYEGNWMLTVS